MSSAISRSEALDDASDEIASVDQSKVQINHLPEKDNIKAPHGASESMKQHQDQPPVRGNASEQEINAEAQRSPELGTVKAGNTPMSKKSSELQSTEKGKEEARQTVNPLIAFFSGEGTDAYHRTLSYILESSDRFLESSHDYIQTLLPLPESSGFVDSDLVDEEVFNAFRTREDLRLNLRRVFERMLEFWGFQLGYGARANELSITQSIDYKQKSHHWAGRRVATNHNHLRITRCLRSLRVLGLEPESQAFMAALETTYANSDISRQSVVYWRRAAKRPLHIPPSVSKLDAGGYRGLEFLWQFENREENTSVSGDGEGGEHPSAD